MRADTSAEAAAAAGPAAAELPEQQGPVYRGYEDDEYLYLDPAVLAAQREAGLQEFEQLKGRIRARTLRFGGAVAAYIALTGTAQVCRLATAAGVSPAFHLSLLLPDPQSADGR